MKKIKLIIAAIALTACNKVYNGSFENCKVVSTEFIKEHTESSGTLKYRTIRVVPNTWKVQALRNNEVVAIYFTTDPMFKTDSIYKLLILE